MEVRLPRLGEGADSGTVAGIFVKVGDSVRKDQPVLELESEKAVASIPSPAGGTVTAIHVKEGDLIKVNQLILSLDEGSVPAVAPVMPREEVEVPEPVPAAVIAQPAVHHHIEQTPVVDLPPVIEGIAPPASPTVRKMARELGIDLRRVRGSERGGRIIIEDVRRYILQLQQAAQPAAATQVPAQSGPAAVPQSAPSIDFAKWGPVKRQKLTTLRRTISTRMSESWNAIPHVTQFDEADITDLLALRKKYAPKYEKKKAHLTLTPLLLRALVKTLAAHPLLNASLDEATGELVLKNYYNIGIAVDTEQGLIVPVLKNVDKQSVFELSVELQSLAVRTRERKVGLDEMQGGTFTVSNQGGIGSGHFTPIINKPEVAILGVARGVERMVFKKNKFVHRSMLPISLSYDHRVIDGADAARFMVDLVKAIESIAEQDVRIQEARS
jgi:pyruvate dehydrogenase E2 component (dihydrolipoamide acetyltransferase)